MERNVYLTAIEPGSGKSAVALGVMEALASLGRVGYFRPIVAGARDDYGVVVTGGPDDAAVDRPASDALRAERRAARGGREPFFDRGPGYAMLAGQPSADIDQPDGVG